MIHYRLLSLFGMALMLAGCSSVLSPKPDPSRFFVLTSFNQSVQPPVIMPDSGIALVVGRPQYPSYLDRPQMVTREGGNEIRINEFNRWAEPVPQAMTRVLADNLGYLLDTDRIGAFPLMGVFKRDYTIQLLFFNFEGEVDKFVRVRAQWRIVNPDDDLLGVGEAQFDVPASGGYQGYADALSKGLGRLSVDITESILLVHFANKQPVSATPAPEETDVPSGKASSAETSGKDLFDANTVGLETRIHKLRKDLGLDPPAR